MSQNFVVFECGHKAPEKPSVLAKVKRALSIKRALSAKSRESKEIPIEGSCWNCQLEPFKLPFGDEEPYGTRVPLRVANPGEDDPPHFVEKTEAERQQERFFADAEAAHEEDRKAREVDYSVETPSRIPQPAGILGAPRHPAFTHLNSGPSDSRFQPAVNREEDPRPFVGERAELREAQIKLNRRLEELKEEERKAKEACRRENATGWIPRSDPQRKK
ncbi:hypothetical protein EAF04_008809 [Stromatinia cepivora]|nr:hypothetical protein EAF04_008809 [Stromatinia cepivora]